MKSLPLPAAAAGLWLCPFRPFFLCAAIHALLAIAWWVGSLAGLLPMPDLPGGPIVWHAHEMLFGFAAASIAGFLLTAVAEFTGTAPVARRSVQQLLGLWLGGRVFYLAAGGVGVLPAAVCDLGFLLLLTSLVAGPLWRDPTRRHVSFFFALLVLAAAQAGFYLALWRDGNALAWVQLAIGPVMILIVIAMSRISMRMVNDAIDRQGGAPATYLARPPRRNLATFAIGVYTAAEFLLPGNAVTGWLALAASAAMLNLLNDWHVGRVVLQRWVLIPYLVYWSMALGYALIGFGLLAGGYWTGAGHHVLLIGAMALAILIVMHIAGRTHSGHVLDRRVWVPLASGLLLAAGLLRGAAGLPAFAAAYLPLLHAAGTLWLLAWGAYFAYSWRHLAGPRPDGLSGCQGPQQVSGDDIDVPQCDGSPH